MCNDQEIDYNPHLNNVRRQQLNILTIKLPSIQVFSITLVALAFICMTVKFEE